MTDISHISATVKKVAENIVNGKLLREGDSVLCALSGGADSVALLVILKELAPNLGITLFAAHLNHGIRGEEADRDESHCRDLCQKLNVPFVSEKVDVPTECKTSGEGLEECARRLRYTFLRKAASDFGSNKICTAHHADDNIETVLMHMIRGCALNGLTGISPIRDDLVRPLLNVRKKELTDFLDKQGIAYVFDSTNACLDSTRNFIRHKILPSVYELNPSADKAFYRMCSSLSEDLEYLTKECGKLPSNLTREKMASLDDAVLHRYIIRRYGEVFAKTEAPQIDNNSVKLIASAIKKPRGTVKYVILGAVTAYISDSGLTFKKETATPIPDFKIPLFMGENIISPIGYRILIEEDKKVAQEWQNVYKSSILSLVNFDRITDDGELAVFVRSKQAGESYVFGKMNRDVRRQLINFKIPLEKRSTLPVICKGEETVLVHGLPVADSFKCEKGVKALYIVCAEDETLTN